jgi:hypothetical protein
VREVLRQFVGLEPVVDLARFGAFLGLALLALFAAWRTRRADPGGARGPVDLLVLYVLAVSLFVGLVQIEAWPFTNWALVHSPGPRQMWSWELEGLDATGRGYAIDPVVLQPMAPEEFGGRLLPRAGGLTAEGRANVARFILRRAEAGRRRALEQRGIARNEWLLGPLAAPPLVRRARIWRAPADLPAAPLVGLRVWLVEWDVLERFADEGRVARRVLIEVHDAGTD